MGNKKYEMNKYYFFIALLLVAGVAHADEAVDKEEKELLALKGADLEKIQAVVKKLHDEHVAREKAKDAEVAKNKADYEKKIKENDEANKTEKVGYKKRLRISQNKHYRFSIKQAALIQAFFKKLLNDWYFPELKKITSLGGILKLFEERKKKSEKFWAESQKRVDDEAAENKKILAEDLAKTKEEQDGDAEAFKKEMAEQEAKAAADSKNFKDKAAADLEKQREEYRKKNEADAAAAKARKEAFAKKLAEWNKQKAAKAAAAKKNRRLFI